MSNDRRGKDALLGAGVTLLAFGLCVWRVVAEATSAHDAGTDASTVRLVAYSLGIAVSFIAHLVFVGLAARAQQRSALLWVLVALFTFPIGSLAALLVMAWVSDSAPSHRPAPPPPT